MTKPMKKHYVILENPHPWLAALKNAEGLICLVEQYDQGTQCICLPTPEAAITLAMALLTLAQPRPMVDAPCDGTYILVKHRLLKGWLAVRWEHCPLGENWYNPTDGSAHRDADLEGWFPLPEVG